MAINIVTCRNLVMSLLNASTIYSMSDDQERHPSGEIDDAIIIADAKVISAILSTPGQPHRAGFLQAKPVTHAGPIPDHLGPIGTVLVNGKAATPLPAAEIERRRTNTLNLVFSGPYFDIVDERLFFSPAGTATVDLGIYVQSGGMLQSPDEMIGAVIAEALAFLFAKEGAETPTAQHFFTMSSAMFEMIKAGAEVMPSVTAYQRQ